MNIGIASRWLAGFGLVAGLSVGLAANVSAAPVFEVTPSALGSASAPFDSDFINGQSSSLLQLDAGNEQVNGAGWIAFTGFAAPGGGTVLGSGLNNDYQLWVTYEYTTQLLSGTFGAAGSNYAVTALSFEIFGSEGLGTSFTQADASDGQAATVTVDGNPAQKIGEGSLINGEAAFTAGGGASFNAVTTYSNTPFGATFFTDPVPFYNVSFNEFNNTSQGLEESGDLISINSASGGVDFNRVPEPTTLGLLGLGLLGFSVGASRRRGA
ncbi:MAG: flocculation-associated PEP-CTERM protein PepA [Spiribacter salinus]|uniref:Flocculation-associated PEP-CTERM protein PepA n=1 Tax=Spiribacter salinus TaxID=1335746 RepID=A0A540VNK0_9GAMM|nr:MAG: flocculation-associated PEP-CTERM protein PepA [Spiribacter salinus]